MSTRVKGPTLTDLPAEILQSICANLCLHCQTPHAVDAPYHLAQTGLLDQKALVSLSLTCRQLRAVAQPVLFHVYLSDSLHCTPVISSPPQDPKLNFGTNLFNLRRYFHERRRASLFLRTLLERDDLAACVRALSLHLPPWEAPLHIDQEGNLELSRLRKFETGLVVDVVTEATQRVLQGGMGGHLAKTRQSINDQLERVQEHIILLCASSLEQLCIERTLLLDDLVNMPYDWRGWSYSLPKLNYLAFLGKRYDGDDTYYYKEARSLISSATKLCTLVLSDRNTFNEPWMIFKDRNVSWNFSLEFLTKLSISGIERDHLRGILRGCPVLQDLEYHVDEANYDSDILSPEEDLSVVKGSLQRLCYSVLRNSFYEEIVILEEDYYPSWATLLALKTLEIPRLIIYGPVEEYDYEAGQENEDQGAFKMELTTPEDFMSRLPQTVETLRIGCIFSWPAMYRDAVALAREAPIRFPHLRNLHLELDWPCIPQDENMHLVRIFAESRITCTVASCRQGSSLDSSAQIKYIDSPDRVGV
ncbi:ammonia transport outward 2 [Fusarium longipes]|uniref:Ammonia transport outward 2 n=1 Tax=Fusarium longipes TaxID=694270 RepID=A0A395SY05_9HYPO|nr:ammonia transport outward 2 [Fusarium longipes]